MSRRLRAIVLLVSTPLVGLVIVGGLLGAARRAPQETFQALEPFSDVIKLIVDDYVDNVNVDKVYDGAMRGLIDDLDGSSAYLSADEVKALDANTPMGSADVGLVVTHQFWLRIVGVRDGSPAARAKLESGDYIRMIGTAPTRDMSAYAGAHLLAGAPGSKVSVLVIRGNTADPRTFDLVREVPPADHVTGKRLADGDADVRVASFVNAAEGIRSSLQTLGSAATSGVVLDLRDVADGTADDAVAAARLFLKTGTLATLSGRIPKAPPAGSAAPASGSTPAASPRTVTTANPGDGMFTMPVVLLVSSGTGNAAEIFAAALQGNKRATLVGEPTAGLASVQKLVRLPEGVGLWLTYEQYLQADGTPILDHGLKPDVLVDIPVVGFDETAPTTDDPLAKADDALRHLENPNAPATAAPPEPAPRTPASSGR